jgi:hypothetical protein
VDPHPKGGALVSFLEFYIAALEQLPASRSSRSSAADDAQVSGTVDSRPCSGVQQHESHLFGYEARFCVTASLPSKLKAGHLGERDYPEILRSGSSFVAH